MKRYKTLFAVILTIFALAFIVFVAFMQQRFNNPDFADLPSSLADTKETEASDNDKEDGKEDNIGTVAGAAGALDSDLKSEDEENNEESKPSLSTRTVVAETLNARSGPGIDYEISGLLVEGQVVEVEDTGDEWVKITTDDFTGFVNEKYLSEE